MDLPSLRTVFFNLGNALVVSANRSWVPGAKEALADLRTQGLRLRAISNTGDLSRDQLAQLLAPDFDWAAFESALVLLSSEMGIEKPAPELFRQAVAAGGATAAECLFCTESLPDALGGNRVGLLAARVLPPPNSDIGVFAALVTAGARSRRSV